MKIGLNSPAALLKGVGKKYVEIFAKNGISTVFDLLLQFPQLYIDFAGEAPKVEAGVKNLYRIEIVSCTLSRIYRRRLSILKINARIGSDDVQVVLFNKHYLESFFKENKDVFIYGAFQQRNNICQVNNPLIFTDPSHEPVIPLYAKIGKMKSGTVKKIIKNAFPLLQEESGNIPPALLKKHGYPGMTEALKEIHFPEKYDPRQVERMKHRFVYGEFLLFQLELQYIRSTFKKVPRINKYTALYSPPEEINPAGNKKALPEEEGNQPGNFIEEMIREHLPFELTEDQWRAAREIVTDLKSAVTMQRLLQGDVGAGKTIVAFIALLLAQRSGYQGAFLAPTEILARQHYINGKRFFKSAKIEILTGSTPAGERKRIRRQLEEGEIEIIFGTHALLNEKIQFKNLSMVIIDEQHRFGVSQRAALYYKGKSVDLLVTTATPIPRTMLLSLYNDLSVSLIKTKPRGRLPIITRVVPPSRRDELYAWLRKAIDTGEKAYIILPLIEESEYFTELRSIESETPYFEKVFKGVPVGIISGRATSEEKDSALSEFEAGKTKVLISTTVIEVGIDVRDATFMVIENADRYGLSQLHQLRGRVGRGDRQSKCYLFSSPSITENGQLRLKTITESNDGFKIAETDMDMRGGGIITGMEQSGHLDFKVGNMQDHLQLFKEAKQDATRLLKDETLRNDYINDILNKLKIKVKEINFS
ncbi:MAG: ATP-dependent DNA helicase RecG [bacterium]|nr:ATP-dependent DNA helicase RecG [bacterium]